eukprot:6208347-Pleurochrysis_carterae.AAC.1
MIFVARWGGWPSFTPLLIKSIAANDLVEFMLLGETKPEGLPLPRNVAFMQLTLQECPAFPQSVAGNIRRISRGEEPPHSARPSIGSESACTAILAEHPSESRSQKALRE